MKYSEGVKISLGEPQFRLVRAHHHGFLPLFLPSLFYVHVCTPSVLIKCKVITESISNKKTYNNVIVVVDLMIVMVAVDIAVVVEIVVVMVVVAAAVDIAVLVDDDVVVAAVDTVVLVNRLVVFLDCKVMHESVVMMMV